MRKLREAYVPPHVVLGIWLSALIFFPAYTLQAAPLKAKAAWLKKTGKVNIKGKTSLPHQEVIVYDTSQQNPYYSTTSDGKNDFSVNLPQNTVPCLLRLKSGQDNTIVKVAGVPASCKTALSCSIKYPLTDQSIHIGDSLHFEAMTGGLKKNAAVKYSWQISDDSASETVSSIHHTFSHSGRYLVTLQATDAANNACIDTMTVSVAPPSGTNPYGKVGEQTPPITGSGLQKDEDSYVLLPYDDMGMLGGGSMVSLPYNPYIGYNSLNAQVIQKVKQKPQLIDSHAVNVFYSAASNPNDPVSGDSINSTSQNLFNDKQSGANFDPLTTTKTVKTTQNPTTGAYAYSSTYSTGYLAEHEFNRADIQKNELWDVIYQPYNEVMGKPQTGTNNIEAGQSRYTPFPVGEATVNITQPDESIKGNADKATDVRRMPGIADPYRANNPQPIKAYSDEAKAFVAQFIPVSSTDDQGRTNPYPLFRVEAKGASGETIATTDAVYTSASEVACRECHTKGKEGADDQVWRTPVTEEELIALEGGPGPATGAGSFPGGADPSKPWPPAIHNLFNDKHPENPAFTNLAPGVNDPTSPAYVPRDANGLRTDRVAESRWWNLKTNQPCLQNSSQDCKLQIRLKFKEAKDYAAPGDRDPYSIVNRDKAALFNGLVMHDYMVKWGPTPAKDKLWPASYSSQLADGYAEDKGTSRANPMYFCSGHHMSQLKLDVGINPRAYITNRSDYSHAFHAFHGKLQVYNRDVTASESLDHMEHKKGDLLRDERGHPHMLGGRGWDSQHNDDEGVPIQGGAKTTQSYDTAKNNWIDPDTTSDAHFKRLAYAESLFPTGDNVPMEQNCLKCHSGPTQHAFRDVHSARGLKCDNCHGDMLAVGNVYPNSKFNANLSGAGIFAGSAIHFRRPWLDEPDCGSCHMGDGNLVDFSDGVMKTAWDSHDKSGAWRNAINARFATMPVTETRAEISSDNRSWITNPVTQALYRKSRDVHGSGSGGSLSCSACHGGSHAIWPNPNPHANDNQTANQLQGYAGNIVECFVCHIKEDFKEGKVATDGGSSKLGVGQGVRDGTLVGPESPRAYLAGPHGMHPVNDPYWWKEAKGSAPNRSGKVLGGWHNDFAKKPGPDGEDQCAACHGSDHQGTRLSRTLIDREFVNEQGKKINVPANTQIGCNLCHTLEKSFTGTPNPSIRPQSHLDALKMEEPHLNNGGGGGGHGH